MASDRVTFFGSVKFAGDCELDFRAYELRRGGRPLKLERIPMEVLLLLVERQGELVNREEIVERVWGKDVFLDTDNSINAAVRKIRQVLKDDPEHPTFVQTVTGRGYRFIATLEEAPVLVPVPEPLPTTPSETKPKASDSTLIGKKVSHYRVLNVLGGGGMGVVYQAEDLKLGRRVALKFLPSELASEPNAFQRLQVEARAASSLDHPNICSIYELGEHEGQPFIAMQFLEGQTLREWIEARTHNTGPLPMDQVLDLAIQIAGGLEAAHEKGIVHRDIKPANIFITRRGQAKILDFGVAKFVDSVDHFHESATGHALDANPNLTRTGMSVGTPSYLSPEQVRGEKLDGRADIFSLGLVLYEMATGIKAFGGNTAPVIREAVLHQEATPIRKLNPQLCPELEKIIQRALEKDRGKRYQSAGELRADAERLRKTLTTAPPARTPMKLFAIGAAAVMLLALVTAYYAIRRPNAVQPTTVAARPSGFRPAVAVVGFRNLSGKPDQEWLSTAFGEMIATELAAGHQFRVLPDENVVRMKADLSLPSSESFSKTTLEKIRSNSNADLVLLGSYLSTGSAGDDKVRVDIRLQDTRTGETIAVASQDGTQRDLGGVISRSGDSIRQSLGLDAISSDDTLALHAALPANMEATRLYIEGRDKLHRFDALGARTALERAIAADPQHALSHSALAETYSSLGYDKKAQEEAKRAFELSSALPREDRLMVEGRYRELAHNYPAAIEIYRTLRNFFPDDIEYGIRLAYSQGKSSLAKDELETINRMRALPKPISDDARIDLAEAHLDESLGDFKRAQQLAASAAAKGQQQGNRLIVAQAKEREAWSWNEMGDAQKARRSYEEAHAMAVASGNTLDAAINLLGIGSTYFDSGNYPDAEKATKQALALFQQLGAQQKTAYAMSQLGSLYYASARMPEAKHYQEEALRIDREIGNGTARDLGNLANVVAAMGDLKEALRLRYECEKGFREEGDRSNQAIVLSNIAGQLLQQADLKGAQQNLEKAIVIQKEIGNKRGLGFSQFFLAEVFREQDHLNDARDLAQKTLDLRNELKDAPLAAESMVHLAEIAFDQGDASRSEQLLRNAIPIFEEQKITDDLAIATADLSRALRAQGKNSEAHAASDRSLEASKKGGDVSSHFEAVIASADLSAADGDPSQVIQKLSPLLEEAHKLGYIYYELKIRLRLAQAESKSGKGPAKLDQLRQDARKQGFELVARQATNAIQQREVRTLATRGH